MIFYVGPPGDTAQVLAVGREYQLGTSLGPPLVFWLADISFHVPAITMLGFYLLAQPVSS